LSGCSC